MKDDVGENGKIIYVGKAKKLRNRVSSYFVDKSDRDIKTAKLVEHIRDFDYIEAPTEHDALVLESNLIKQHQPKYNIDLKDSKGFNYVKVTAGDFPRLIYTHNTNDKSAKYIGPYVHPFTIKQAVSDANKIFMLPSCRRRFPESFKKEKACLNHRIKRCIGVCQGEITSKEYKKIVRSAIRYIKGGSKASVERLTREMETASENLDFEKAAQLRDQITAIKRVEIAQQTAQKLNLQEPKHTQPYRNAILIELAKLLGLPKPPEYIECYDISNIGEDVKVGTMVVYKNGKPLKKAYRKFNIKYVAGLDDYACMREVIERRFTGEVSQQMPPPDLILLDGGAGHVTTVKSVLTQLELDVNVFGLVKDSKHKTRAVATFGGEIEIQSNRGVFTFLTKLQEEVHRFSVEFARVKHKKSSFALSLTEVSGIGQAKATALLKHFKTKAGLKSATAEELSEVAKINKDKAEELKKFIEVNF